MAVLDKWTAIINRRERRAALFGEMMQRFGLFGPDRSFSLTDGPALGRAARVCLNCQSVARCEAWMNDMGPLADAERFCPNAGLFRELGQLNSRRDVDCRLSEG